MFQKRGDMSVQQKSKYSIIVSWGYLVYAALLPLFFSVKYSKQILDKRNDFLESSHIIADNALILELISLCLLILGFYYFSTFDGHDKESPEHFASVLIYLVYCAFCLLFCLILGSLYIVY